MSDTISSHTLFAILLIVCGGIIQSIGYLAQKKAHKDCNKEDSEGSDIWYAMRWCWILGIVIFIIGSLCNAIALQFGAQCILIPLMCLPLIWTTLISACLFNESVQFEDFLAFILIFFGCIMVIIFGPTSLSVSGQLTVIQLRELNNNIFFVFFFAALSLPILFEMVMVKYTEHKNYKSANNKHIRFGAHFLMFSYCIIAAYFDCIQLTALKAIMSLLASSIYNTDNWQLNLRDYFTYVLIAIYIGSMLLMELYRQRALAYFGALYVLPLFETWSLILATLMGGIYFQELQGIDPFDGTLFVFGMVILSVGLIVLTYDIGQVYEHHADYIAVAFVNEHQVNYHHTKGMVYAGWIPKLFQEWYFHSKPFFENETMETYMRLNTMNRNGYAADDGHGIVDEYDDSEDDLQIADVHPLPVQYTEDLEDHEVSMENM